MCLRHNKLKLKKCELMNHRQGGSMDMESYLCALAPKNSFDLEADTDRTLFKEVICIRLKYIKKSITYN